MCVWDKLQADAYKNDVEYPPHPKKPRLGPNPTSAQAREYAAALELYETVEMPEHKKLQAAYYARASEIETQFQDDLESYYDMKDHPKRSLVYSKAYERGHSAGFGEVANAYSDYVELVK